MDSKKKSLKEPLLSGSDAVNEGSSVPVSMTSVAATVIHVDARNAIDSTMMKQLRLWLQSSNKSVFSGNNK